MEASTQARAPRGTGTPQIRGGVVWRALTVNLARRDRILDRLWALAVDLATHAERCAKNLLHNTLEGLGEALEAHGTGDVDNVVKRNGLAVLDVLLLLAVARRLLEGADDQGGGSRDNGDGGLTVLDGELAGDAQALLFGCKKSFVSLSIFLQIPPTQLEVGLGMFEVVCARVNAGGGGEGRMRTQSPVALAMSSPTFLGERPRGPILGARAEEAPTSPPVARR